MYQKHAVGLYRKLIKKYGNLDIKSLGYADKKSQEVRFKVLSEIGIKAGATVLDLGCGYGDFADYFPTCIYTGYDIMPEMLEEARTRHPRLRFVEKFPEDEFFDWVIACGVFNLPGWDKTLLAKMFFHCNFGVAVNFISAYSTKKIKDRVYHRVEDILDITLNLTNKWTIRHDYRPNDWTLYLWK